MVLHMKLFIRIVLREEIPSYEFIQSPFCVLASKYILICRKKTL